MKSNRFVFLFALATTMFLAGGCVLEEDPEKILDGDIELDSDYKDNNPGPPTCTDTSYHCVWETPNNNFYCSTPEIYWGERQLQFCQYCECGSCSAWIYSGERCI